MINPMIVEGQVDGGVAQGVGSALLEELVYDNAGQVLTSTLTDYLLPSASERMSQSSWNFGGPSATPMLPLFCD